MSLWTQMMHNNKNNQWMFQVSKQDKTAETFESKLLVRFGKRLRGRKSLILNKKEGTFRKKMGDGKKGGGRWERVTPSPPPLMTSLRNIIPQSVEHEIIFSKHQMFSLWLTLLKRDCCYTFFGVFLQD
jgi:hypothetical protein